MCKKCEIKFFKLNLFVYAIPTSCIGFVGAELLHIAFNIIN